MHLINNTIYTGPKDDAVYNEIDRNMLHFLLGDYMFISYHDIEKGVFTYRDLNNPNNKKMMEMLKDNDSIFQWFVEIVNTFVHEEDREAMINMLNPDNHVSLLKDKKSIFLYYRWNCKDEGYKYYKLTLAKIEDADETPKHIIIGAANVDEAVREKLVSEKEKDLQLSLLDGLSREYHTVWLIRPDKSVRLFRKIDDDYSRELLRHFEKGLDYDRGVEMFSDRYVAPDDVDRFEEAMRFEKLDERVPEKGFYSITFKRIAEHGELVYLQICISRAVGSDGELNYVLASRPVDNMIREELKRQEEYQKAMKERDIDSLTGIHNRFSFDRRIKVYPKIEHEKIACIYIDVDGLHELNNTQGHAEGDELIKCVGVNILKYWGRDDTFRIGGDEFVAFCFDTDEDALFVTVEQFRERIIKSGYSVSIGWAIRDVDKLKVPELLRSAENAMYDEKEEHYSGDNDRRKRR